MDVVRGVLGVAIIFGPVVILLILLNWRDRRASWLHHTVLDQLALPDLRGRVGVHIQCAVFSGRRAILVDLLASTPCEVWDVFTRLASRLPPRVRLTVHSTTNSGFKRPFVLETTTGRPFSHEPRTPLVTKWQACGMGPARLMVSRCSAYRGHQDRGGKVMTRILVPTDFSESSLAAVRSGMDLATAGGGVVVLLHVVEGVSVGCYTVGERPRFLSDMIGPDGEYFGSRFDQQLLRHDFCEEAHWKLNALVPPKCQARVHTVVTVGRAVDEIVRVAKEQHADLILLGAGGRRGWRQVFRRTMADRLRRKAMIPVVTLDAEELCVGRDSGRWDVPDQHLGSGRVVSHSAELVGMVQDMDASRRFPRIKSTAQERKQADDGPESPALPQSASRDERGGRHSNKRSRPINV
jgi:nucleotide-binding universal stress UspA family protein